MDFGSGSNAHVFPSSFSSGKQQVLVFRKPIWFCGVGDGCRRSKCEEPRVVQKCLLIPGNPRAAQHSSTSLSCEEVKAALGSSWAVVRKKYSWIFPISHESEKVMFIKSMHRKKTVLDAILMYLCRNCIYTFCRFISNAFFFNVDFSDIDKH